MGGNFSCTDFLNQSICQVRRNPLPLHFVMIAHYLDQLENVSDCSTAAGHLADVGLLKPLQMSGCCNVSILGAW